MLNCNLRYHQSYNTCSPVSVADFGDNKEMAQELISVTINLHMWDSAWEKLAVLPVFHAHLDTKTVKRYVRKAVSIDEIQSRTIACRCFCYGCIRAERHVKYEIFSGNEARWQFIVCSARCAQSAYQAQRYKFYQSSKKTRTDFGLLQTIFHYNMRSILYIILHHISYYISYY